MNLYSSQSPNFELVTYRLTFLTCWFTQFVYYSIEIRVAVRLSIKAYQLFFSHYDNDLSFSKYLILVQLYEHISLIHACNVLIKDS